jgi:hypothetical protein
LRPLTRQATLSPSDRSKRARDATPVGADTSFGYWAPLESRSNRDRTGKHATVHRSGYLQQKLVIQSEVARVQAQ